MDSPKHIRVSAPGKIILHGEHAVVYQKAGVALSLDLRTRLDLKDNSDGSLTFSMDGFIPKTSWDITLFQEIFESVPPNGEEPGKEVDLKLFQTIQSVLRNSSSKAVENGAGDAPDVSPTKTEDIAVISFLYVLIKLSRNAKRKSIPSLSVSISSEIAISAGLGSSAAFAVCVVASLLSYFGFVVMDPKSNADNKGRLFPDRDQLVLINRWAYLIEKIIHGNASGIDNTVSTFGGIIKYQDQELTIVPCNMKLDVLIVDTKIQRDTRRMVERVRNRRKLYPTVVNPILESIHGISETAFKILEQVQGRPSPQEYEIITDLTTMNHQLLCALGVSHPALDAVCSAALKWGLAAKLTGAGGGGCAIIIFDPDLKDFAGIRQSLISELRSLECSTHAAQVGGPGVMFHPVYDTKESKSSP